MPGGEDCEAMIGATTASHNMEWRLAGKTSGATSIDARPANTGVTDAGGTWGPAVQQLALRDSQGMIMCEQQPCDAGSAWTTQVPTDSSNTPTRVMTSAVRWPTPRSMVSAYHAQKPAQ